MIRSGSKEYVLQNYIPPKSFNSTAWSYSRFKDDFEISIVCHGNIALQTSTVLNGKHEFSKYEFAKAFAEAVSWHQRIVKGFPVKI